MSDYYLSWGAKIPVAQHITSTEAKEHEYSGEQAQDHSARMGNATSSDPVPPAHRPDTAAAMEPTHSAPLATNVSRNDSQFANNLLNLLKFDNGLPSSQQAHEETTSVPTTVSAAGRSASVSAASAKTYADNLDMDPKHLQSGGTPNTDHNGIGRHGVTMLRDDEDQSIDLWDDFLTSGQFDHAFRDRFNDVTPDDVRCQGPSDFASVVARNPELWLYLVIASKAEREWLERQRKVYRDKLHESVVANVDLAVSRDTIALAFRDQEASIRDLRHRLATITKGRDQKAPAVSQSDLDKVTNLLNHERDLRRSEYDGLTARIQDLQAANARLETRVKEADAATMALAARSKEAEAVNVSLQTRIKAAEAANATLEDKLDMTDVATNAATCAVTSRDSPVTGSPNKDSTGVRGTSHWAKIYGDRPLTVSAASRALGLLELLTDVLDYVNLLRREDGEDEWAVAQLALVARGWVVPVLSALMRCPSSLRRLFGMSPPRQQFYAAKVRELHLYGGRDLDRYLANMPLAFSHLHELSITRDESLHRLARDLHTWTPKLFSPSLRVVSIRCPATNKLEPVSALANLCPRLQSLTIEGEDTPIADLVELLERCPDLETLLAIPSSRILSDRSDEQRDNLINALANHKNLRTVQIMEHISDTVLSSIQAIQSEPFPALRSFEGALALDAIPMLVSMVPSLTDIRLDLPERTSHELIVSKFVPLKQLQSLALRFPKHEEEPLALDDLMALGDFPHLTSLSIESHPLVSSTLGRQLYGLRAPSLDDTVLAHICGGLPRLQHLTLEIETRRLTPKALFRVARHCPVLEHLELVGDFNLKAFDGNGKRPLFPVLRTLVVGKLFLGTPNTVPLGPLRHPSAYRSRGPGMHDSFPRFISILRRQFPALESLVILENAWLSYRIETMLNTGEDVGPVQDPSWYEDDW